MQHGRAPKPVRLEITWATILKVLLGILFAFCAVKLWPVVKMLVVAILLAVVLYRIVSWSCRKHWPRWVGSLLAITALLLVIGGFFGLLVPTAAREASKIVAGFPKTKQEIVSRLPQTGPVSRLVEGMLNSGNDAHAQQMLRKGVRMAETTAGGLIDGVIVLALII